MIHALVVVGKNIRNVVDKGVFMPNPNHFLGNQLFEQTPKTVAIQAAGAPKFESLIGIRSLSGAALFHRNRY